METTPTPPAPKSKSTLDTVANIAIILVCAIAAFVLVRQHFFNQNAQGGRPPEIEAGDQFKELGQVVPAGTDRALVVALAPDCHFCEESMPFYKRLVEERNRKGSKVKVIAAVGLEEAKAEEQKKLDSAGVSPDALVVLPFDDIKLRGTPTIVLVDNQGEVHNVWIGKQPASGEEEILETL